MSLKHPVEQHLDDARAALDRMAATADEWRALPTDRLEKSADTFAKIAIARRKASAALDAALAAMPSFRAMILQDRRLPALYGSPKHDYAADVAGQARRTSRAEEKPNDKFR
ncbi:hypothetical protein [Bradyrhizobium sp. ORS 86]|uniref:hypothetical protein n=1 Tax=Bradyrhizobium sp. ORS 86 TaxID=1685970 RepID=UPI00389081C1